MDLLSRSVGIWIMFVMFFAAGVGGVLIAFGGNCNVDEDCTDANNVCTATKCACSSTSYKEHSTTKCAKKIALGGNCTTTPTGQCAATNADCTKSKCVCTSSYFANKKAACASQVAALNATCEATDSSPNQCAKDNSECRTNGTVGKCMCKATYYAAGGDCVIRKKPEETCAAHQCVTHATCNTKSNPNKCKCNAGYTATPTTTPTMCSGVIKVATLSYILVIPVFVSMMFLLQ